MKRSSLSIACLFAGIASIITIAGTEKGILAIIIGIMAFLENLSRMKNCLKKGFVIAGIALGVISIGIIITLLITKSELFLK